MFRNTLMSGLSLLRREPALEFHPSVTSGASDRELPILKLGMVGFTKAQSEQIIKVIQALPNWGAIWAEGVFADADCCLVCGENIRAIVPKTAADDLNLRILAGHPGEQETLLNLSRVDRPVAFSTPPNTLEIEPRYTFDPTNPQSLRSVLTQFKHCLQPTMARFVLGKQLLSREMELKPTVYHAIYRGKLLAVLDFINWRISMLPSADPRQLENAVWEKRPAEAGLIPKNFSPTSVSELRWIYAQHSGRNVLPARYKTDLIYFRQAPRVPVSWISDSLLRILNELAVEPANFVSLGKITGMTPEQLSRDLASLYFAASLTTTPTKASGFVATAALQKHAVSGSDQRYSGDHFNSSMPHA